MKKSTKEILLRFDEIGSYEAPRQFDYRTLVKRVHQLSSDLKERFGCAFKIDDQVQDASFYCDLIIPLELVLNPKPYIGYSIRISNFGSLATINFHEKYPTEIKMGIIELLEKNSFLFLDAHEIDVDYDGNFEEFKIISPDSTPSWYVRYFDYL